jgi:hypothetical protein
MTCIESKVPNSAPMSPTRPPKTGTALVDQ